MILNMILNKILKDFERSDHQIDVIDAIDLIDWIDA